MPREDRRLLDLAIPYSDIEFPVPTRQDFGGGRIKILATAKTECHGGPSSGILS